ncbi:MAG: N-acetyl-gamma-glutamyl-phosphate reductase [Rhodospirillaceae bacterium]
MSAKIFIDGEVGTTGLQIKTRLEGRSDLELLHLPENRRKNADARAEMLNAADVAILCLPDDAAREAVTLIDGDTRVIDASTAHRTADGWVYGFPEYKAGQREAIAGADRVANTGCYAVASVALLHPLIKAGAMPPDYSVTINAVSGYSGGGRLLIQAFEDPTADNHIDAAVRVYSLGLKHKHVPEIQKYAGLTHPPLFVPTVGSYMQGMIVQIPVQLRTLPGTPTARDIHGILVDHYKGARFVSVTDYDAGMALGHLEPEGLNGSNDLELIVFANEDSGQIVLTTLLDNLGKGASGQAVQLLNIMLGAPEETGLDSPAALLA